ncbi:MAG TPA: glycosyltransferase family 4 protein [Rhizomicrobium sp.]|jgi:glycosyltransferase involved in cell wall biosynthesis|nr:glycosyltransferase family 4 protein [Rhizomicrobium sp.]
MNAAIEIVERPRERAEAAKRFRLLHVFHSFGCGGAQTRFLRIANHFGPALEHVIVSMNGDYSGMSELACGVHARVHSIGDLAKGVFGRLKQFDTVLQRVRPDRLVTHNWGTIEWALPAFRRDLPHIHIEDGFGPDEARGQKHRRTLARRMALRRSDVVVPSHNLQEIAKHSWKISASRLHYIPNGIDSHRYSRPWQWREEPVIGVVAALRPEKNIERLLGAFAMVSRELPCRLVIVGDGTERSKLEAIARHTGISERLSFTGYTADPVSLYHSFNVFALSSDTEQMPFTILEAMAVGLPIIATDVGDIRVMVSKENAALIVERSEEAVAGALLELLRNPRRAEQLGATNSLKVREQYDQSEMFRCFAELYGIPGETRRWDDPRQ